MRVDWRLSSVGLILCWVWCFSLWMKDDERWCVEIVEETCCRAMTLLTCRGMRCTLQTEPNGERWKAVMSSRYPTPFFWEVLKRSFLHPSSLWATLELYKQQDRICVTWCIMMLTLTDSVHSLDWLCYEVWLDIPCTCFFPTSEVLWWCSKN